MVGSTKTQNCRNAGTPEYRVLESHLEEVKFQLDEIQITKPKDNLPNTERKALKTLQEDPNVNLKPDKATQTVA